MADGGKPDLVLGTAGHIDHGKSALILALTGTDPDRLAEEKRRGITIQLGFAQLTLPDGRTMGVVDVPGHEKFVKQMIAGSTGIDVALLTIAADDGVMPQTIEHVAVLQTLGVPACVVALTKIDLVDAEWVEFMTGEVRTYLAQTAYADAAIVPVSSRTGAGLDDLREAIREACKGMRPIRQANPLRLPIDRVFTIKGAGTVVTGTLWSGEAKVDDEVELLPSGRTCRVRSVQMHDTPVDAAPAGNRVALNLNGVKTDEVRVGDWVAAPRTLRETDRFDAWLTYLDTAGSGKALKTGSRMHIAHGTREVLGRVLFCNGAETLLPGQGIYAQIRLEEPLPVCYLDRFIVRTYSPVQVAGGGMVLLPRPRRRTTLSEGELALLDALRAQDLQTSVESALQLQRDPVSANDLAEYLGMQPFATEGCLQTACTSKHAVRIGASESASSGFFMTQAAKQKMVASIERALIGFHAENPQETGIAKEALRQLCMPRASAACWDAALFEVVGAGKALVDGGKVGHPSASGAARKAEESTAAALLARLGAVGATPPTVEQLAAEVDVSLPSVRKALAILEKDGSIRRLSSELFIDAAAMESCEAAVADYLNAGNPGTVASLKDAMGVSRKYAVPLLEYMDQTGFTVRDGDTRSLRRG